MWLHIVIFVILLLLTVCSTLGWIHVENIGTVKGRKMFLVVALAGNITGGLLTWTKGGGQVFEDGYELKKEENAYEEKFMVSVEGEETGSVYVQIPEKELEKEDTGQPEVLTKEEDEEQKLLEFVANYNSELEDSEYYYLPSDWEGRKLEWKIPYDTTGNMLAAIFLAGGPLAALRVAGLGLHADFGEALDETFGVVLRCVVDDGHLLAGNVDLDILHSLLEGNVVHDALGAVFAIDVGLEYRRYGRCLFRILRCGRAGAQPQCCHEADEQNLFHTRFVLVLTVNIKLGSTAGRYRTSFQTFLKPPFSKGGLEGLSIWNRRFYAVIRIRWIPYRNLANK
mgnify:CR=1 FL=1